MSRRTFKYSLKLVSCSTERSSVCWGPEHRRLLPSVAERCRVTLSVVESMPGIPLFGVYTAPLNETSISYSNKLRKLDPALITIRCLQYTATFTYGFVSVLYEHASMYIGTWSLLVVIYSQTGVFHFLSEHNRVSLDLYDVTLSKIHLESVVMVSEIYKGRDYCGTAPFLLITYNKCGNTCPLGWDRNCSGSAVQLYRGINLLM